MKVRRRDGAERRDEKRVTVTDGQRGRVVRVRAAVFVLRAEGVCLFVAEGLRGGVEDVSFGWRKEEQLYLSNKILYILPEPITLHRLECCMLTIALAVKSPSAP